jgi:heme exporter protein C
MKPDLQKSSALPGKTGLFALAPLAAIVGGLCLSLCMWLILVYAPIESTMRLPQKIFYLHVPIAWWGLFSFFLVFVASSAYLATRKPAWDTLAGAAAEVGLVLGVLVLATGCLWGKPSWGVWWTWDARLTTSLVMCFVYAGYLILRGLDMQPEKKARMAAVVGIVAFLDVPLVFFSARLWSYIHPPSISLEPEMKLTVIACVAAFGLFWLGLLAFRYRLAQDEKTLEALAAERLLRQEFAE